MKLHQKVQLLIMRNLKKKIEKLKLERNGLILDLKKKSEELIKIRSLEYKDIIYNNKTISPIEAAKFIESGKGELDIIPGKTTDDEIAFPLTDAEVSFIYRSNEEITFEEEQVLNSNLPKYSEVWTEEYFRKNVDNYHKYCDFESNYKSSLAINKNLSIDKYKELEKTIKEIKDEINGFSNLERFLIKKTIQEPCYESLWENLFNKFDLFYKTIDEVNKIKYEYDFKYEPQLISDENLELLNEIIISGKQNPVNKFSSILKPKWSILSKSITNNGECISKNDEYIAIEKIFYHEMNKTILLNKINKLLSESGELLEENDLLFKTNGKRKKDSIKSAVMWFNSKWQIFINDIVNSYGINTDWIEENIDPLNPFDTIIHKILDIIKENLSYMFIKINLNNLKNKFFQYEEFLKKYKHQNEILDQLIKSVNLKDVENYKRNYNKINEIIRKSTIMEKRKNIIDKVIRFAPGWGETLKNREGLHGKPNLPENIKKAWKWRQLVNQIERIDKYNPNEIQRNISKINEKLLRNARLLAHEKAWYNKIKSRTAKQVQAIEGWRTTQRQIGKGKGKRAPELMKKARELMPLCQSAIPVWIMPLNRVVENFDPRNNKFDVVIIDEASQSDILALAALYLGKKIIIVGDDEQVSPDSVGLKSEEVNALIEMFLQGIPNNHLFNGQTSLYDMAKSSSFKPLMLTEHFRCLPEIIHFSNKLSYNGRIKPLRDSSSVLIKPPVVEYRVNNGTRDDKKINKNEALHIASIICSMIDNPSYKEKTIGVISMLGSQQCYEVDRLLQRYLSPIEYEDRKIQCGTSSQFQGDERDVIIISIVDGPNETGGPIRLISEDGRNDMYRKRYNVAASRARDQLWVVHSLNPEIDLKPDDIRLRLIKHAEKPFTVEDDIKIECSESPFEEEVMRSLINKGYYVHPQYNVGSYRIDMVVEYENKKIAIECDGEKWHTRDDLPNDLKRQAILERLGWRFIRIRGSVYYRDPSSTMESVFNELKSYGIKPNFNTYKTDADKNDNNDQSLLSRIKKRANKYRKEWEYKDSENYNNEGHTVVYDNKSDSNYSHERSKVTCQRVQEQETPIINDNNSQSINEDIDKKSQIYRTKTTVSQSIKLDKPSSITEKKEFSRSIQNSNNSKKKYLEASMPKYDFSKIMHKKQQNKTSKEASTLKAKEETYSNKKDDSHNVIKPRFDFRK
jgi:superfamily I DNA and/or RNA helicase/very-short-patch-repair endonuclease